MIHWSCHQVSSILALKDHFLIGQMPPKTKLIQSRKTWEKIHLRYEPKKQVCKVGWNCNYISGKNSVLISWQTYHDHPSHPKWCSKDSLHLRIFCLWKKGCECRPKSVRHRRENTRRLAQAWAGPWCVCVFHPGVLPVPDWSPLHPPQVKLPAPLLSQVPKLGIHANWRAERILRQHVAITGYLKATVHTVMSETSGTKGYGTLPERERSSLQNFSFPSSSIILMSSDKSLCYRATNVLLAYHNLFTSCFNFLH